MSQHIGRQDNEWHNVGLALKAYGLGLPTPDPERPDGDGASVLYIIDQYRADLTEAEALAIIRFGLIFSREFLEECVENPSLLIYQTARKLAEEEEGCSHERST